jgi:hypothetical protein
LLENEIEPLSGGERRPKILHPRMSAPEIKMLRELALKSRCVTEFGIGGSTSLFVRSGAEMVVSVESDARWIEAVLAQDNLSDALAHRRVIVEHVDLGPVRAWGYPANLDKIDAWPTYSRAPWPVWDRMAQTPDLVLVDGRFRVACCARTAEFLIERRVSDALILVHDVTSKRAGYQRIFDFMDEIRSTETLFLLRCKAGIGLHQLRKIAEETEREPQ